jgi:hypothetical protein
MSEIVTIKKSNRSAIALIVVVILALAGGSIYWWNQSHPNFDRYSAALAAMKSHHVNVDTSGNVDLSADFPGLVPKDRAQVTWLDDGNFRAMFPTDLGEGTSLIGLLYTSRPLTDDDTNTRSSAIRFQERVVAVGSYPGVVLDKKLNDNWYRVSYRIH